jgi:hypothetical protein
MSHQPLTVKAKAAIVRYVEIQGRNVGYMQHFMVGLTLKADRMPRSELYGWLERRGYRWDPKYGFWLKKDKNGKRSH